MQQHKLTTAVEMAFELADALPPPLAHALAAAAHGRKAQAAGHQ
jgi:hypothetical protein